MLQLLLYYEGKTTKSRHTAECKAAPEGCFQPIQYMPNPNLTTPKCTKNG